MKRVITLLMAAVMVVGSAGLASAIEFKASGHLQVIMGAQQNGDNYNSDDREDYFYAGQRFRPKLTMKGEGVTGVFEIQQHQFYWGGGDAPGGLGGTGANSGRVNTTGNDYRVRNAYIDFKLPGTPVSLKVGYQQLNLPSIWGHPLFHTRVGAAVATVPVTDGIAVAAFYARPYSRNSSAAIATEDNSVDMYGILAPMDFGTAKAAPYFVYSRVGLNSGIAGVSENSHGTLYVAGANIAVTPNDALSAQFDIIMTSLSGDDDKTAGKLVDDAGMGWMFAMAIDYEMPFGTPGLLAWYSPGADKKGKDYFYDAKGAMTDGFGPMTYATAGGFSFAMDSRITGSGANTMGVGLQVADMSFVDSLKHTVKVAYIQGTAHKKAIATNGAGLALSDGWTEKDKFIAVDFDSTWSMYENLAAIFEVGAVFPQDWNKNYADRQKSAAWRAQCVLNFKF